MYTNLVRLRQNWGTNDAPELATEEDIAAFEQRTGLLIPGDLRMYFKTLNGTSGGYDKNFTQFYSLHQFKSVEEEVGDYGGVPDYTNIVNVLQEHENCYVFAEHSIHVLVYAIRLSKVNKSLNEIYIICGEQYEMVASSFNEYIGKYVNGIDLYI